MMIAVMISFDHQLLIMMIIAIISFDQYRVIRTVTLMEVFV